MPFKFKQFNLHQENATWKVGTDSVLLGAWCDVNGCNTALDAGCGTGLLALMLAQRNPELHITGIEVDSHTAGLAALNFRNSPWSEKLECFNEDIVTFAEQTSARFDLIISNPPYYPNGISPGHQRRVLARTGRDFDVDSLVWLADTLLAPEGRMSVVVPFEISGELIRHMAEREWNVQRRIDVRHAIDKRFRRSLLEFGRSSNIGSHETLSLYDKGIATSAYASLIRPYRDETTYPDQDPGGARF